MMRHSPGVGMRQVIALPLTHSLKRNHNDTARATGVGINLHFQVNPNAPKKLRPADFV